VHNKLLVVYVLLNTVAMDRWIKTRHLKHTLEKCEGSVMTASNRCEGQVNAPSVKVKSISSKEK
jgi:hypothetical protein